VMMLLILSCQVMEIHVLAIKKNILCLGDSLTREGSWLKFLTELTNSNSVTFNFINGGKNGRKSHQMLYPLKNVYTKKYKLEGIIIFIGVNDLNGLAHGTDAFDTTLSHIVNNISDVINESLKHFPTENVLLLSPCNINPSNLSSFALNHGYGTSGCAAGLKFLEDKLEMLAVKLSVHFLSLYNVVDSANYIDGVHLSIAGYHQVASAVATKIMHSRVFSGVYEAANN